MTVYNISVVLVLISTIFAILRLDSVQCYTPPEHKDHFLALLGSSSATDGFNRTADSTPWLNNAKLIFEENFDFLNKSRWTREVKIPTEPDYEFCVYHGEGIQELVEVKEGSICIKPLMLEDHYGNGATTRGQLNFSDCTSNVEIECARQAASFFILPPVISARLSTKNSFSFKYGKIEIRAKFPLGDWLYPEMWLEPKHSIYGAGYDSGRILLGLSRGNNHLMAPHMYYGARRLDFGLRVREGTTVKEHLVTKVHKLRAAPNINWNGFHTYTTIWTYYGLQFLVDGYSVGHLLSEDRFKSENPGSVFTGLKNYEPFSEEFYITIGLGVGGIRVFPDYTVSAGNVQKPWKNSEAKAMLKFWNGRNTWLSRWGTSPQSSPAFYIDYIRVWCF